jgi:hypothetical protein
MTGVLSVDFGTSNTVAVLAAHGRPPAVLELDGSVSMPSAVFAAPDGTLIVGREAVRRARIDPSRFEPNPKRRIDEGTLLLGDRVVPVTDAIAAVLGRVFAEVARALGGRPDEVRLTHPAKWGSTRREVLLAAARQAGVPHPVLIPEPVAAAAHFASFPGKARPAGAALAVYDLGAGTFDVGIVDARYTVLAEAGLDDLGGLDVDHALVEHIGRQVSGRDPAAWQRLIRPESTEDRRAARLLWEDVRAAKESLSAHPQTDVALPAPFGDVLVTRAELEDAVRGRLLHSVHLLKNTIAGLVTPEIYLVGGSSRMPLVAKLITEELGVVPSSLDMPETSVALGAHLLPGPTVEQPPAPARPLVAPKPKPKPKQRRARRAWYVAALIVIAVVATVLLSINWDQQSGAPEVKYDVTGLPACSALATSVSATGMDDTTEAQPAQNTISKVSCSLSVADPAASVVVEVSAYPATLDGRPGKEVAIDAYHNDLLPAEFQATRLAFGEQASVSADMHGSSCGIAQLVLLDQNAIFTVTYGPSIAGASKADCVSNLKSIARKFYDAAQPL